LSALDAQRDQATHYYSEVSEDILYVHAQSSVTLFERLVSEHFDYSLSETVSGRILPISAKPPTDLIILLENELNEIDKLLHKNSRKSAFAVAKLRSVMAFTNKSQTTGERVSENELSSAISDRKNGKNWSVIFPEIVQLKLSTDGVGLPIAMRISKDAELGVRVLKQGEEGEIFGTIIKQVIDPWSVFCFSRDDLAVKLEISGPKTSALISELKLMENQECYKILRRKKQEFKGYSKKALDLLRTALETCDMSEVWDRHRYKFTNSKPK
jgi:hypothetical protein